MPLPKMPTKKTGPKKFELAPLGCSGRGKKVILYGDNGLGKTTLCALLKNPGFISLDGGADEIVHPITGEKLIGYNAESFREVRDMLQSDVFESVDDIVIDHITELERLALPYTFDTVKMQKGQRAANVEDYGFHKGYRHWHDSMLLILSDCDRWVRKGKNVVLIAQSSTVRVANPAGEDFLKEGPELYHDKNVSTLNAFTSWADHVLRLGYSHLEVTHGKVGSSNERAVFVHPEVHFYAKSRTISSEYPVVSFADKTDASIWRLMFGENQ